MSLSIFKNETGRWFQTSFVYFLMILWLSTFIVFFLGKLFLSKNSFLLASFHCKLSAEGKKRIYLLRWMIHGIQRQKLPVLSKETFQDWIRKHTHDLKWVSTLEKAFSEGLFWLLQILIIQNFWLCLQRSVRLHFVASYIGFC